MLKSGIFANYEVGLLHGRMNSKDKEKVMKYFKNGKIKVLVSTIVIEVGIDVANATVMVIENAERFGLAQLHQLRGRIGRGTHESYCILLADPKTDEAAKRIRAIEGTTDGFEIAQSDLELRGREHFDAARAKGKGVICFSGHCGNWELMALAFGSLFGDGAVVVRRQNNPFLNRMVARMRMAERLENRVHEERARLRAEAEKARRTKRGRSRNSKARMLENKRHRSSVKSNRGRFRGDD